MRVFLIRYGDPILDFIFQALHRQDHEVAMIEGERTSLEDLKKAVIKFSPDLIVIGNLDLITNHQSGDAIEAFLTSGKWNVTCWYFEAPRMAGGLKLLLRWQQGPYPKNIYFLETDRGALDWYRSRGLAADHLPLAIDARVEFFNEPEVSGFDPDVAFSGTPNVELYFSVQPGRRAIAEVHKMAYQTKLKTAACSWDIDERAVSLKMDKVGEQILPFLMDDFWDQEEYEKAFQKVVEKITGEPELSERFNLFKIFAPACLHVTYSFVQLTSILDQLIEKHQIQIYGSPFWERLLSRYGKATPRLELEQLHALYRRAKINFCLTKRTFQTFMHERAFQILGHGGFPLVDYREELPLYFDKGEIASYRSAEEAIDLISYYKTHDSERKEMAAKGRKRVFKEHTYDHRTSQLLKLSAKHFGLRIR